MDISIYYSLMHIYIYRYLTAAIQKLCSFPTLFALKLVGTNPQHATTLTRRELGAEAGTALVLSSLSKMFFRWGLENMLLIDVYLQ